MHVGAIVFVWLAQFHVAFSILLTGLVVFSAWIAVRAARLETPVDAQAAIVPFVSASFVVAGGAPVFFDSMSAPSFRALRALALRRAARGATMGDITSERARV
jgi:hypothetical protein